MSLGKKIHDLRTKADLTQKELAEKLHVTSQAVSRWEQEIVEPSIGTIVEMAKIFNVSVDEIVGKEKVTPTNEKVDAPVIINVNEAEEKETFTKEDVSEIVANQLANQKRQIGVCAACNRPILEGEPIVRKRVGRSEVTYCAECDHQICESQRAAHNRYNRKWRNIGWILASIGAAIFITLGIIGCVNEPDFLGAGIGFAVGGAISVFTFIYCLCAKNNFISELWWEVASWGYVKFPGIIFDLSLDGIIWLLTVKLLFWILGFILATAACILATILGMLLSVFVFPFSVYWSYKRPEKTESAI